MKKAMKSILFLLLSCATCSAEAWTQLPSKHLECDRGTDAYGRHDVAMNCRLVDGSLQERGFRSEPADPKEVMMITKDINGYMTIERRDGSSETFKPNSFGGWDRYN